MNPPLPRWYRTHSVARVAAPVKKPFVPDLVLLPRSELRGDPLVERLLFVNTMAFVWVAAAATALARRKGLQRWHVAQRMGRSVESVRWLENGVDPTGRPVAAEVIEYATALGYALRVSVTDVERVFARPVGQQPALP